MPIIEGEVTHSPLPTRLKEVPQPSPPVGLTNLDFLEAMKVVVTGGKIARQAWRTKVCYVQMHDGIMRLMKEDHLYHDWIISEADIRAQDWKSIDNQ